LNKITDISALVNLKHLQGLGLQGGPDSNQIIDISPLSSLVELNEITLSDNRIRDISPLLSLPKLQVLLILEGNPLSSDSLEKYLPQLKAKGVNVQ